MKKLCLTMSLLSLTSTITYSNIKISESEYQYSGQQAVDHLIETGECAWCDLRNQDLRDAIKAANKKQKSFFNFSGNKIIYLLAADLRGADLRGADLKSALMASTDLRDADLRGANLRDTDLRRADMRNANLIGADLIGADLSDVNMKFANMKDTNMTGADTTNTEMTYVRNLDKAIGYKPSK